MASSENIRFFNPPTLPPPPGYTQVVAVTQRAHGLRRRPGRPRSPGALVGPGDFRAQAQQVFANIKAALDAAGATFADVVKLTFYLTDMADLPLLREVRDAYVNTQQPPASTAVQVARLARAEFLLEVEAIAAVPA